MNHRMTIAQICGAVESPLFDRKSARIDAKTLAIHLIAFANADGGMIAVGVEDDGTITGILNTETFEAPAFKMDGGFARFNKKFGGQLAEIIREINTYIYEGAA